MPQRQSDVGNAAQVTSQRSQGAETSPHSGLADVWKIPQLSSMHNLLTEYKVQLDQILGEEGDQDKMDN